ncbi:polysaccharide biosynthesis/export family protein [Francisellaceae bacterium]|nr:polysaccharide biosynthesis/export family protein [Francisellaceae bacterium]
MADNDDFTPSVNRKGEAQQAKLINIDVALINAQRAEQQKLLELSAKNYKPPEGFTADTLGYEYKIGYQDVLNVIVWNDENITNPISNFVIASNVRSNGFTVDTQGRIYYPYIGYLKVVGLKVEQARDLIANELKEYMKNPQITLDIVKFNSQNINVTGAVRDPMVISVTNVPMTVLDAINTAGGPIRCGNALSNATGSVNGNNQQICADTQNVIVKQGSVETSVDIDDLEAPDGSSTNWLLERGSVVFIPTNRSLVYVLGDVFQPGAFNMMNGEMSLKDAIVAARGVTSGSAPAYTYVVRNYESIPEVFTINLKSPDAFNLAGQFALKSQDIVFISRSGLETLGQVIGYVAPVSSLAISTASLGVSLSALKN